MGRNEDRLPPSEALPGIGEHPVVFHNGTGFYYICIEYASEFDKRLFECVQPECRVTAGMGEGTGSPLIDVGRHSHPPDPTYREKCLLLHNIRQRLKLQEIPATEILRDALSLLEKDNCENDPHTNEPDTCEEITEEFQIVKTETNIDLGDRNDDYDMSSKISDIEEHHTQDFLPKTEPFTTLFLPEENMMDRGDIENENCPEEENQEADEDIEDCYLPSRRAMRREIKKKNIRKAHQSLARKQDANCSRIRKELPTKKKRKQYSDEDLNKAVHAINSGALNVANASRLFGIPHTTLSDNRKKRGQWQVRRVLQTSVKETKRTIYSDDKLKGAVQAIKFGKSVHSAVKELGIPYSTPRIEMVDSYNHPKYTQAVKELGTPYSTPRIEMVGTFNPPKYAQVKQLGTPYSTPRSEMVGSYSHPKSKQGDYKSYNNKDMEQSITAIKKGSSYAQAGRKFGLPQSTLKDKFDQNHSFKKAYAPTYEDEKTIIEKFESVSQEGFPISEQQLVSIAVNTVNSRIRGSSDPPIKHDFKMDFWLTNFLSRHPEIKGKLSKAPLTEDQLLSWLCDDDNKYL